MDHLLVFQYFDRFHYDYYVNFHMILRSPIQYLIVVFDYSRVVLEVQLKKKKMLIRKKIIIKPKKKLYSFIYRFLKLTTQYSLQVPLSVYLYFLINFDSNRLKDHKRKLQAKLLTFLYSPSLL